MSESDITSLNKYVRYTKLSQFLGYLQYKTFRLIKVNPYNTSKTCNFCGYIHKDLKLSDRKVKCLCGVEYDRDENASYNIFCLGQAILSGCIENTTINQLLFSGSPYLGKFSFSRYG
jgi:transposase